MAASQLPNPDLPEVLGGVVHCLPPAAIATQLSEAILPYLTPILRQRLQVLGSSSTEPWIRLLCYDAAKAPKLNEIAQSDRLEPHPVSGEVEIDWDYDSEIRYRRLDDETFQAFVALKDMDLAFRLVYCSGEADGWKVGEVTVTDTPLFSAFGGFPTIQEAERHFRESQAKASSTATSPAGVPSATVPKEGDEEEDDDDDYWARYDATPARTPAPERSPGPVSRQSDHPARTEEEDYYAQYDSVQPAMDNHDPDEEANLEAIAPPLGMASSSSKPSRSGRHGYSEEEAELNETNGAWTLADPPPRSPSVSSRSGDDPNLVHPRPESSTGSHASVEKLEAAAENFGVQQHISRSIKSLYTLGRSTGMERSEFERIVKRELELLSLMEE